MKKIYNFIIHKLTFICSTIGSLILLVIISIFLGLKYLTLNLPKSELLGSYNPPVITKIYDNQFEQIAEYATEPRIFTSINNIPKKVINAFIAAEDKTFFNNYGIDPIGILRAIVQNIGKIGTNKRFIGASTITQQVVQNFLVGKQVSLERKLSEAIIAYRLSMNFSKEKILEIYLNQVYLGNNSYGVTQAAKGYFGKKLEDLTIEEVAILAALPKAPSILNPYVNYDRALIRRNWVIKRMAEDNMISPEAAQKAIQLPINLIKSNTKLSTTNMFYVDEVKNQLKSLFDEKTIYNNGLVINTHLDPVIQKSAYKALIEGLLSYDKRHGWRGPLGNNLSDISKQYQKILKIFQFELATVKRVGNKVIDIELENGDSGTITDIKWISRIINRTLNTKQPIIKPNDVILVKKNDKNYSLEQIPDVNGAIVVIENYTGRVLALIGGLIYESGGFNRVTQAMRQPGSILKTSIYAAAIENGFSRDSIMIDEPIYISQGKGMPLWAPQNLNHKFNGPVSLQEAFTRSLNIPTLQIGLHLGLNKIYEMTTRLGIYPKVNQEKYLNNYSILLGAFETTLLNITKSYAVFASGGYNVSPNLIGSIYDRDGNLLYYDHNIQLSNEVLPQITMFKEKLIKTTVNQEIIKLLQANMHSSNNYKLGGKTGSSNDSKDTWFIGMSSDFTVGIFVGFDQPRSLGKRELGATVAKPIFMSFIKDMFKTTNSIQLPNTRPIFKIIDMNDIDDNTMDLDTNIFDNYMDDIND